jgi:hypothetical protein
MKNTHIYKIVLYVVMFVGVSFGQSNTSKIVPLQAQILKQLETAVAEGRTHDVAFLSMSLTQLQAAELMEVPLEVKREFVGDPKLACQLVKAFICMSLETEDKNRAGVQKMLLQSFLKQTLDEDDIELAIQTIKAVDAFRDAYRDQLDFLEYYGEWSSATDEYSKNIKKDYMSRLPFPSTVDVRKMVKEGPDYLSEDEKANAYKFLGDNPSPKDIQ